MKMVIVDSHPVIRQGIISILTNEKGIEEIKEASNIEEAMNIITKEEIEISIIDYMFFMGFNEHKPCFFMDLIKY